MATTGNWRTLNVDALDPDSPANFDLSTLKPQVATVSDAEVQSLATQIRQLLRGGDNEGALLGALENAPYGAEERGKVHTHIRLHIRTIHNPEKWHAIMVLLDRFPARWKSQMSVSSAGTHTPVSTIRPTTGKATKGKYRADLTNWFHRKSTWPP